MRSDRFFKLLTRVNVRITATSLLVAIVLAQIPVPVVSRVAPGQKDLSRPFACQSRACGCRSAEQCRKKCCCFSNAEKLAWAQKNGVSPDEVVAPKNASDPPVAEQKGSCCLAKEKSKSNCGSTVATKSNPRQTRTKLVIGIVAQNCQGIALTAFGTSVYVIPLIPPMRIEIAPTGEQISVAEFIRETRNSDPPVPPPRIVSSFVTTLRLHRV